MKYALLSLLLSVPAFAEPSERNVGLFGGEERRLAEARRAVGRAGRDSVFDGQTPRSPGARIPVGAGRHGGALFAARQGAGSLKPPAESAGGETPPAAKVPSPGNGVFAAKDGGGGGGGGGAAGLLKNPAVATGMGLLLGALIGFAVAGPLGAFVGAAIGGVIGWRLS